MTGVVLLIQFGKALCSSLAVVVHFKTALFVRLGWLYLACQNIEVLGRYRFLIEQIDSQSLRLNLWGV